MASLVTNLGLANIVAAWVAYASVVKFLQWGTGSGQGATSTTLATAAAEARVSGSVAAQTTNTTNDTMRITGTITASGSRAITEVAAFDAAGTGSPATGGNMGIYGDFSVINLSSGDSIAFTVDAVLDQG